MGRAVTLEDVMAELQAVRALLGRLVIVEPESRFDADLNLLAAEGPEALKKLCKARISKSKKQRRAA